MLNFFESEDRAKRQSLLLVALFMVSVALVILLLYGATLAISIYSSEKPIWHVWDPQIFGLVTITTSLVIFSGTIYKTFQLRQGGEAVAGLLRATPVLPGTGDVLEQRLINVVQEMSIAAQVPLPKLYVLTGESGINACAAGYAAGDSAIIVTRGALTNLSRDELAGVIGHEFSHILNGDMGINMQLLAMTFGLIWIAEMGQQIFCSAAQSDNKEGFQVFAAALALLTIGWFGVFLAEIIRAALSRQRELLADASAVQFTRNNEGLLGALRKIADSSAHSYIRCQQANQVNHFLFADAEGSPFMSLFDSHPPLSQRIQALEAHTA
jgi:Zn-dependent protease with chaperone function